MAFCSPGGPILPTTRRRSHLCHRWRVTTYACAEVQKPRTRVLIIGGTGRAGSETARAVSRFEDLYIDITIAGRNISRGNRIIRDLPGNGSTNRFAAVDLNDSSALDVLVSEHDVVVHTAGPFQGRNSPCEVLSASIKHKCDYVDICDDVAHAELAVSMAEQAVGSGTRALICTGVYPGLSNLAAKTAAARLLDDGEDPSKVNIWYYTAGSGGIGPTVLASTFLILSEKVQCYDAHGKIQWKPAGTEREVVDFGRHIGERTTYLLNLPEVPSLYNNILAPYKVGECTAKFATGPAMWNALLQLTAGRGPKQLMRDRGAMSRFAAFSMPVVRLVDMFVGSRTAFIVCVNDKYRVAYEHKCLRESVGETTAAFVAELILDRRRSIGSRNDSDGNRSIEAGVYYPEQLPDDVRERIVMGATKTADLYDITEV